MKEPILTVICLTYNHGKYIRKALEGFVNQKTKYDYKVLVHDDASTDNTPVIIQEFADKYPDIIVPILQKENQYSKGVAITNTFILPRLEGKYVAICEGDDYWCDENKLQTQIDYLENNPDCSFCGHNTEVIDVEGNCVKKHQNKCTKDCDYSVQDIIENGGGALIHTSAFVYRKEYQFNFPKEFRLKRVSDYPLSIYLATCGRVHYFGKVMSKYRTMTPGSWTVRTMTGKKKANEFVKSALEWVDRVNRYTGYKYNKSFCFAKKRFKFNSISKYKKVIYAIFNSDYRKLLKEYLKNKE